MTNQMTRDEILQIISDAHKDAYGFRPRNTNYAAMDIDTLRAEFDRIVADVAVAIDEETRRQDAAIVRFEELVARTIENGAGNRETAVRWIREAQDEFWQDDDSLCYKHGLPYTYCFETGARNKFAAAA